MRLAHLAFALIALTTCAQAHAAPVIIAIAAAIAGTITVAQIVAAVLWVIMTAVQISAARKAKQRANSAQQGFSAEARDRMQIVRSPVQPHRVVYGQSLLSGPLAFAASTGESNQYMHLVIPLASHEVEEIGDVYLNDEIVGSLDGSGNVTSGRFAGRVRIKKHLGSTTQSADADLVAETSQWTVDHRLRGLAYLYIRLEYSNDVFPNGLPNVRALVKGKKLYDPRSGLTEWSDNWALCIRDYLSADYGLAATNAEIDDDTIIAAANICDESVSLAGGGSQARYTCNGTIDLGYAPRQIMEDLLTGARGNCVFSQGVYRVFAAAYAAPTVSLTESDLRGSLKVRPRMPRKELFNAVRGTYVDPNQYWQPTEFAPIVNATYQSQDDDQQIFVDIELPYTTDPTRAQRLAKIALEEARQQIIVDFPCKLTGFKVAVMDTVQLSISHLGWTNKEFRVLQWKMSEDGGVDLSLQETAEAIYDWDAGEATTVDPAPNTTLPDAFNIPPPGTPEATEQAYETSGGSGVKFKTIVTFLASPSAVAAHYQLEFKLASESNWRIVPPSSARTIELLDLAPGIYDLRVKAISILGVSSAYASAQYELHGLMAPPVEVSNLTIQTIGGLAVLRWTLHPDLDVRIGGRIVFRHSPVASGATWATATTIGDPAQGNTNVAVLPLKAGTYLAKAEDSSGQQSLDAAEIATKQATILAFGNLTTLQEDDEFSGTHGQTMAPDGELKLAGLGLFDDIADLDDTPDLDSYGGLASTGTYDFAGGLDLGSVTKVRLTGQIQAVVTNDNDLIDSRTQDIDDWVDFDGIAGQECDAWIEVRETDDDPAGAPTWSPWKVLDASEFDARGFEFRCLLESSDPAYNIRISELRVHKEELA